MNSQNLIHSIIQRIATGPELSKNIETEEAEGAMSAILSGEIDEVQAAIFLIALRMKRETMEENIGILEALLKFTDCQKVDVDNLVDIGDSYNLVLCHCQNKINFSIFHKMGFFSSLFTTMYLCLDKMWGESNGN